MKEFIKPFITFCVVLIASYILWLFILFLVYLLLPNAPQELLKLGLLLGSITGVIGGLYVASDTDIFEN